MRDGALRLGLVAARKDQRAAVAGVEGRAGDLAPCEHSTVTGRRIC